MATTRVLFDTPILIDLLERRPRAIARLRALADQGAKLAISILSVAEIHAGISPGEEKSTARLLDLFDVIPLSEDLARKTSELVAAACQKCQYTDRCNDCFSHAILRAFSDDEPEYHPGVAPE
jgi:predicted nucleic acid-binding protein